LHHTQLDHKRSIPGKPVPDILESRAVGRINSGSIFCMSTTTKTSFTAGGCNAVDMISCKRNKESGERLTYGMLSL
ncbi:hypothetical protein A2U01_0040587, partial [Trifolium medium]|nr:hypothetical protein [Trifolium medium]